MKTQLTAEESAKLIELGVSPKRASKSESSVAYGNGVRGIMKAPEIPIFTLADILDILPKEFDVHGTSARLQIYNTPAGYWVVSYATCGDSETLTCQSPYSAGKELIDALYSLLVWRLYKGIE